MENFASPIPPSYNRSNRVDRGRGITTGGAGVITPLRYIPLFREDSLSGASVVVSAQLGETVRPLQNAVHAEFEAWFVPFAAFPRFADIGDFNRSYAKVKNPHTNAVDPFIQTGAFAQNPIWRAMGVHMVPGEQVNLAPIEAYNVLVNYIYGDRSPNLAERTALDTTLATAFWQQNRFGHVKPNYDRSLYDGIVPIQATKGLPVRGIGITGDPVSTTINQNLQVRATQGDNGAVPGHAIMGTAVKIAGNDFRVEFNDGFPMIRAILGDSNAHISLANIELAKQSAAFEQMRKRFAGHDDDEIIALLMQGIRVPEYMERQPMRLATQRVQFSFGTRYATAGDLTESVTNGLATASMRIAMPRTNTGGIVLITASVVPDQLFERRRDSFLAMTSQDQWPQVERDTLDVEKVDTVLCKDVEVTHANGASLFGYEPMNYRHNRDYVRLGGHLYRPTAGTSWDEDRAGVWVTEPVNPTLTADWYLAKSINLDPFADRNRDPITYTVAHDAVINGHTVFGPPLLEVAPGNQ